MKRSDAIRAELVRTRAAITRDVAALQTELDVTTHLRRAVKSQPYAWLCGAAIAGYVLSGSRGRTRVVVKSETGRVSEKHRKAGPGILGRGVSAIKFIAPVVRPVLMAYLTRRVSDALGKSAG